MVEIIDNDAGPGLSVSDESALEGRNPQAVLEFEVTLDRKPDKEVRVDYATSDSTATAGTDYEAQSGTLVFRAGEDEKVVRVPVVFDRIRERAEYLKLTLSNARGAHIEDAVGVGKIRDYNTWAGIKGLSVADASGVESSNPQAALNFKVTLAPTSNQLVMVGFATSDSTAKAGRDYEARSGWLVFLPGMGEIIVPVRVLHDTRNEGSEYMKLTLSRAVGADIQDAVGVGEIRDPATSAAASALGADADDIPDAVRGLTPERAAAVLFGEAALDPAAVQALDRLGNGNGRYDLGDLLSWIDRCRRGEADRGGTATDSRPAGGAALPAAAQGGRTSGRTGGAPPGPRRRRPKRRARRRGGKGGSGLLAMLLAAAVTWSCTDRAVGPAAIVPDPGFLTVELSAPAANRDIGVLGEIEGPGIGTVRAPGYDLYESESPEPRRIVVAGPLRAGELLQFEVPDRNQLPLYRVRVVEVTGEDYGPRDPGEYRAVITN